MKNPRNIQPMPPVVLTESHVNALAVWIADGLETDKQKTSELFSKLVPLIESWPFRLHGRDR
jgi:hypothetical protein